MSNEAKMSLEEKLVQRIKSDTLMAAIGDEDMLTELVKRALHEALFQQTRTGGYNSRTEPSLVVSEAREIAKEAITALAKEMFAEIVSKAEVREAINKAMPILVVDALKSAMASGVSDVITAASYEAESNIRNAIASNRL